MSIAELPHETEIRILTFEEFLALPEDGISRELIRGELRERGSIIHNRFHAELEATIVMHLGNWLDQQPRPRGEIVSGEAGFRLRGPRDSAVGIDVAYVSAEHCAATPSDQPLFEGPPVLAVEILSPSDTHEDVVEKVGLYLEAGVVVWVADPDFQRVSVHRPGHPPETFNIRQELSGEPYLPGFRVPVADLFGA